MLTMLHMIFKDCEWAVFWLVEPKSSPMMHVTKRPARHCGARSDQWSGTTRKLSTQVMDGLLMLGRPSECHVID